MEDSEKRLFVVYADSMTSALDVPKRLPKGGKLVYFLKGQAGPVDKEDPSKLITCHDLSSDALQHLDRVVRDVYLPLLTNPSN